MGDKYPCEKGTVEITSNIYLVEEDVLSETAIIINREETQVNRECWNQMPS